MAGSGSLTGSMVLELPAGVHTVALQWQKTGSGVMSWWSQPQFLDGFVTSRSLVVIQERFSMIHHQALTNFIVDDPRSAWRDVPQAAEEVRRVVALRCAACICVYRPSSASCVVCVATRADHAVL
jgi:hypothetical protein